VPSTVLASIVNTADERQDFGSADVVDYIIVIYGPSWGDLGPIDDAKKSFLRRPRYKHKTLA
jgi:hypothetical protein